MIGLLRKNWMKSERKESFTEEKKINSYYLYFHCNELFKIN